MTTTAKTPSQNTTFYLTEAQTGAMREAGFTDKQIAALPNVRGLSDEQILLADSFGLFPEGDATLEEIAAMPDDEIDFSDIPKPNDEYWAHAVLIEPKPRKELVSIRLDSDILEFFRSSGPGYQSRINAVLRLWMKAHPAASQSSKRQNKNS